VILLEGGLHEVLLKGRSITFNYITNEEELNQLREQLDTVDMIGLDTETKVIIPGGSALDPHTAAVKLIQLNWLDNDNPYVIDVDKVGFIPCLTFLKSIQHIIKIIHNAQFDLKMIFSTFNIWLENVRCSMTAMKSLSVATGWKVGKMRGHSLKSLARDFFDIELDKAEAVSDWSIEDLSLDQLEYAASDVMPFLIKGYLYISNALTTDPPLGYGNAIAFNIEQNVILPIAKLEFSGMHTDIAILNKLESTCIPIVEKYKLDLCSKLNLPINQEVDVDDNEEMYIKVSVSQKTSKLLNNNKGLVTYVNETLKGIKTPLDNLQAEALELLLDSIDGNEEDLEQHETSVFNKDLIQTLLSYKKYVKLLSDVKKYKSIINKETGCIHTTFHIINAGTSRMASSEETTRCNLQQINKFGLVMNLDSSLIGGDSKSIETYMSLRNAFTAPPGRSVCISDFSGKHTNHNKDAYNWLRYMETYR